MTKYIDAEEFIEDIKAENTNLMMDGLKGTPRRMALSAKDVIERINEIPTADVQEVVRCKDCKYCQTLKYKPRDIYMCVERFNYTEETDPDGFCHRGKRKECDEK